MNKSWCLSKFRTASTHDLALAHELGIKFATIQCQVNVEIHSIKCALRGFHAFEIFFQVLTGKIRCEGDDFLDTYCIEGNSQLKLRNRHVVFRAQKSTYENP